MDAGPEGWSEPVRALQPGEDIGRTLGLPVAREFYIETEYGDIRGARSSLRNDRSTPGGMRRQRLPRGTFDFWRQSPEL